MKFTKAQIKQDYDGRTFTIYINPKQDDYEVVMHEVNEDGRVLNSHIESAFKLYGANYDIVTLENMLRGDFKEIINKYLLKSQQPDIPKEEVTPEEDQQTYAKQTIAISREQIALMCSACAKNMESKNIKALLYTIAEFAHLISLIGLKKAKEVFPPKTIATVLHETDELAVPESVVDRYNENSDRDQGLRDVFKRGYPTTKPVGDVIENKEEDNEHPKIHSGD